MAAKLSLNRNLHIVIALLIVTLIIDTSLVKINDLVQKYFIPVQQKLLLFSINTAICMLLQFIVMRTIVNTFARKRLKKSFKIRSFYLISFASYSAMVIILGFLVFQQFNYHYYETWVNLIIVTISYGSSSILISWLALLFFNWYTSTHDYIVFLYFISMSLISIHLIISLIFIDIKLNDAQYRVREFIGASGDVTRAKYALFANIYNFSYLAAFCGIWLTTAVLMNFYRKKTFHSVRYWIILIIPLVYFLITHFYQSLSFIISPLFGNNPVMTTIIVASILSLSKPIGGLLFAVVFWNMSKAISYERTMNISMVIAGYGIFLIFSANQAISQIISPYPPFGVTTLTIMNLGAFLVVLGIFNSATLVSANNDLRELIYRKALKFLTPIGRAEMEQEIQSTVKKISNAKEMANISEREKFEFDEDELKKYLKEIIEVKKKKISE